MESSENGKVDCQVSEWSKWSRCESCRGYTMSTRQITVLLETYSRTPRNSSMLITWNKMTSQAINIDIDPSIREIIRRIIRICKRMLS